MKQKNTFKSIQSLQSQIIIPMSDLKSLKQPYLNRVELSKLRLQSRLNQFQNEKVLLKKHQGIIKSLVEKMIQNHKEQQALQKLNNERNLKVTSNQTIQDQEQDCRNSSNASNKENGQQFISTQKNSGYFAQWQGGKGSTRAFKNSNLMNEQYVDIFNKKKMSTQALKPKRNPNSQSQKKLQEKMIEQIFNLYKNKAQDSISFQSIETFFNDCKLYYITYDIRPGQLQDLIKSSSHTYPDKLSQKQFFSMFFNYDEKRHLIQYQKVQKKCIFTDQQWTDLKKIFDTLDVFGDNRITIQPFFNRLKTCIDCRQLFEENILYFPSLNKYYTLRKVLFDLQYKKTFSEYMSWEQIKEQILNFQHIQYPTIDQIYEQEILNANIEKYSNAFILKQDVISLLIQQFCRCPKFCKKFVKCKYFLQQVQCSEQFKPYYPCIVRKIYKQQITFEKNLKLLQTYSTDYFDMDQMLGYFSVRGFEKEINISKLQNTFHIQTQEDQFEERKFQQIRQKRMKSLDKMNQIIKNQGWAHKNIIGRNMKNINGDSIKINLNNATKVQEFNLTSRRQQPTIRQLKLKAMIEEKQKKQLQQLKPYVKANPIPAAFTTERYLNQQQKFNLKKQKQKYKKYLQAQEDQKRIKYLTSNTKLFQKKKDYHLQQMQSELKEKKKKTWLSSDAKSHNNANNMIDFDVKPISWFIREHNLLEVIEGQKQQRRKNRLKQTQEKYFQGYWKNLPMRPDLLNNKKILDKNSENHKNPNKDDSLQMQIRNLKNSLMMEQRHLIRATSVPDFKKLQQQFKRQLQMKKQVNNPTEIKQFNLSVSKPKKLHQESNHIRIQQQTQRNLRKIASQQSLQSGQPNLVIGTTKKYQQLVKLNKLKRDEKQYQQFLRFKQEKQRKLKQKTFGKYMKNIMKIEMKQKNKQKEMLEKGNKVNKRNKQHENSVSIVRKNQRQKQQYQQELRQMYQRVLSKPFMFQQKQNSIQKSKNKIKNSDKRMSPKTKQQKKKLNSKKPFTDARNIPKIKIPICQSEKAIKEQDQFEWEQNGEDQDSQFYVYEEQQEYGLQDNNQQEQDYSNVYNEEQQQYQQQQQTRRNFMMNNNLNQSF